MPENELEVEIRKGHIISLPLVFPSSHDLVYIEIPERR
jgi:hypothetical protein